MQFDDEWNYEFCIVEVCDPCPPFQKVVANTIPTDSTILAASEQIRQVKTLVSTVPWSLMCYCGSVSL